MPGFRLTALIGTSTFSDDQKAKQIAALHTLSPDRLRSDGPAREITRSSTRQQWNGPCYA